MNEKRGADALSPQLYRLERDYFPTENIDPEKMLESIASHMLNQANIVNEILVWIQPMSKKHEFNHAEKEKWFGAGLKLKWR